MIKIILLGVLLITDMVLLVTACVRRKIFLFFLSVTPLMAILALLAIAIYNFAHL